MNISKRIYNKETIAGSNYETHQMSLIPPSLPCNLYNQPFFNSRISANHDKEGIYSANHW